MFWFLEIVCLIYPFQSCLNREPDLSIVLIDFLFQQIWTKQKLGPRFQHQKSPAPYLIIEFLINLLQYCLDLQPLHGTDQTSECFQSS